MGRTGQRALTPDGLSQSKLLSASIFHLAIGMDAGADLIDRLSQARAGVPDAQG